MEYNTWNTIEFEKRGNIPGLGVFPPKPKGVPPFVFVFVLGL
jgi:hypothetical protein